MDDAGRVRLSKPFGHLDGDAQRLIQSHALPRNQRVKCFAGDVFHHQAIRPLMLEDIVNGNDIRMI